MDTPSSPIASSRKQVLVQRSVLVEIAWIRYRRWVVEPQGAGIARTGEVTSANVVMSSTYQQGLGTPDSLQRSRRPWTIEGASINLRMKRCKRKRCRGDTVAVSKELDRDLSWVTNVRDRLTTWYAATARDLPWRVDRDPYRILVSEMMLIQTTVAAVIPFFEKFVNRFPTAESLASAKESDVLKAWEGLGYYRRARQLHAAARLIVAEYGGRIPDDPKAVRALPGVGRYIAGAVLSLAFNRPEPIVEANSQRVLARLLGVKQDPTTGLARERIWVAAERLVSPNIAGTFNQALMELGALVCTPREPRCPCCPLSSLCAARQLGLQDRLPIVTPKPPPLAASEAAIVVRRGGKVLIVQRGPGTLWEHFWEYPTLHLDGADPAGRSFGDGISLARGIEYLTGVSARIGKPVHTLRYIVTRHRVKVFVHIGEWQTGRLHHGPNLIDARWVEPRLLAQYTFSAAGRRLSDWINQDTRQRRS
jgi:A/G-specific adenine glycosylase